MTHIERTRSTSGRRCWDFSVPL